MSTPQVNHPKFGLGTVLLDNGQTKIIRFDHGIEEVPSSELETRLSVREALISGHFSSPLETVLRTQAAAIQSINMSWGVFSRSRIKLLPHQLWTCHQALRHWPIRKLIADDVGLGKTIEAGLILWPLISSGKVKRLLILTPAPLVEQWQQRMREMFDIRLAIYLPELDRGKADFWNTHFQVVASLPTLRADNNNRHERLLDAETCDLVVVDEAHHLHATETTGKTLGLKLLEKMQEHGKITSLLLFTGTPHRGKSYGFWSLMNLLDNQLFNPNKKDSEQFPHLPIFLIRNNKQKVVDMEGNPLFKPIQQYPKTYQYSEDEAAFYQLMTQFIQAGNAYASNLSSKGRGQVTLVLIALQKLASSSVAAVLAALQTRRNNLLKQAGELRKEVEESDVLDLGEEHKADEIEHLFESWIKVDKKSKISLMENEVQYLEQLIQAAKAVTQETRIQRILEITKERFNARPVLIFTEYKTTQALIVSALIKEYGTGVVGFINGENMLHNVQYPDGSIKQLNAARDITADQFNAGKLKYLVSTEAAGEGIDLQKNCHCLIHADLPWNPMRLHQRVGRLNRYGQKYPVEVVSLRNPNTVESKIWTKLEEKIRSIMLALGAAMTESEDLMQLILGMTSPAMFDELFANVSNISIEALDSWFDEKTQTLGGKDVMQTVAELIGKAQSFDLSGLNGVPKLDLVDLQPFFKAILAFNGRRFDKNESIGFDFVTPDQWRKKSPTIKRRYEKMLFSRENYPDTDILGIGHPMLEQALTQAMNFSARVTILPALDASFYIFSIIDRVTNREGQINSILVGAHTERDGYNLLKDAEILNLLNKTAELEKDTPNIQYQSFNHHEIDKAKQFLQDKIKSLNLPFSYPELIEHSIFLASNTLDQYQNNPT
jgi:ERCC4-related helicase